MRIYIIAKYNCLGQMDAVLAGVIQLDAVYDFTDKDALPIRPAWLEGKFGKNSNATTLTDIVAG